MALRRFLSSLGGRITVGALLVSIITLIVTAAVSIGVIQRNDENQARQQLRTQTEVLSRQPDDTVRPLMQQARRLTGGVDRFALIGPDGTIRGAAAAYVTRRVERQLEAGRPASTTEHVQGDTVVLEGVPRAGGGAVVGVRRVAEIRASSAAVIRWILLAFASGLAAAIVAGLLLGRLIGRPLERVARSARRLAHGERAVGIEPQRIPEIEDIATALRTLDSALTMSEDRQREFLLSVSHEIRTPLTAIRGYAEALADGVVPAGDLESVGRTLGAEAERLSRFVSDLLELARLETDDFPIELGAVDLAVVLAQATDAWSGACSQLGVALQLDLPGTPLRTVGDPMRMRQVVDGLIENALRVTPSGSPVVVAGFAAEGALAVEVRDGGPGLGPEDAAVAFDRGILNRRYRDTRPVGTGLGLSIAQRLVGRLGGTITAGSAPEGGACFRVSFPLQNPNIPGTISEPS